MLRPTHAPPLADHYRQAGLWRDETLWRAFETTAARFPEHLAIVDGGTRTSFATLASTAERAAGGLAALGIRAGDVVTVQLPNWHETVVVLLAIARLGAVANPVLPTHGRRELDHVLRQGGARLLVIPGPWRGADHPTLAAAARADSPALEHVVVVRGQPRDGQLAWSSLAEGPAVPPHPTDADAVALLMYTSGTSAEPKGVLHSHATLLAEARSLEGVHGLSARDVVLMPSPLTHVSGLIHALLVPATTGTTAVLMERWEPGLALDLIERERVTYMVGAPTFLRDLALHPDHAARDVSSFRLFSCGGADVDPNLVRDAAERLGCIAKRVYGSTEFPTITTTGPDDPPERCVDSEGRLIGAAEIRLVDEDGSAVPPGREGEILARGPECFLGYADPALNAAAFTADGWFRTEDLGVLDAAGFLRISGRRKDIIIRKGENISAREIEDLLAQHDAVREVAVVGVPDPACGEIACAVLRLRDGAAVLSLDDVTAWLTAGGLSRRKLPERLAIVDDFPRTASGKILKRELRRALG